ncbi:MAG: IS66 family transposase, partial [Planctomycetota bacterium]
ADLQGRLDKALERIEELERAAKRPANPFSKRDRKKDGEKAKPKPRGRKKGKGHWRTAAKPSMDQITERLTAELPARCSCGGDVRCTRVAEQYVVDLPKVDPRWTRFDVEIGQCTSCGKRAQGRHPKQISDAIGGAGVQFGPNTLSLATIMNKRFGVSWAKVAQFIEGHFGIKATPAACCRGATERLAELAKPIYEEIREVIRLRPAINADETSWRIDGRNAWLWIATSPFETAYAIRESRGGDVASKLIGDDYRGILGRDGWAAYRRFTRARHQTCLAHLFKRANDILELADRGAARFAKALLRILKSALTLRDERDQYTDHGFAVQRGRIQANLDRLLRWNPTYEPNSRFVRHLRNERGHILTFLFHPEADATNWRAEQGIRPAVVSRKMSGGNRSKRGAEAQGILMSVATTCVQRGQRAFDLFVRLLRGDPAELNLALTLT